MKITKIYHPERSKKAQQGVLRVAAYCRVSTRQDEQLESFETQQAAYTEIIESHEGWEMAGIYADRGISGLSAAKRPEFQRMIKDCESGLIDIILCKSVSRFARHTKETVFYIRRLGELGVRLIFEKEDIDTDSLFSEMTVTIVAAFAEEESRSMSENVKWSKRRKAQMGEVELVRIYGYRKAGDNYEIVPEEAEAVKQVFNMYEHGVSTYKIAEYLSQKGIPTFRGEEKWNYSRLNKMIENDKYVGDYTYQKTYLRDVLDTAARKNCGELPIVYIKDHHDPIITREQFKRCNLIKEMKKINGSMQYPFGEYLRCPYCGHVLFRRIYRTRNKSLFCCEGEGACRKFVIDDFPVKKAILEAYNTVDIGEVQRIACLDNQEAAAEAQKLLNIKEESPTFDSIHYWWLDELFDSISFGQHSHTTSDLMVLGENAVDDRTISFHWRCGLTTTLSSGVVKDDQDPRKEAERWISYVMCHPKDYPRLVEEINAAGIDAKGGDGSEGS